MRSNLVTVLVAEPQDNSILVPDAQVIFPPVDLAPTEGITDAYPIVNGDFQVGDFTLEEVLNQYNAITVTSPLGEAKLEQTIFAMVVEGVTPAKGQILISSEAAQLYGRVLATQTRGSTTLVTLEVTSYPETFKTLDFYINSERMIQDGIYTPEITQLIGVVDENNEVALYERTPETTADLVAPYQPESESEAERAVNSTNNAGGGGTVTQNQPWYQLKNWETGDDKKVGDCKIASKVNWASITLKPEFYLHPLVETGIKMGTIGGNEQYVENAKFAIGMTPSITVTAEMKFQLHGEFDLTCQLMPPREITIPLAASGGEPILTAINALLRPTALIRLTFGLKATFEGGPKLLLTWGATAKVDVAGGFEYKDNSLSLIPPSKYEPKFEPAKVDAILTGNLGVDRWKGDIIVGIYLVGEFKLRVLGSVFDLVRPLGNSKAYVVRVIKVVEQALTIDALEVKVGAEVSTAWATPQYVLWDHIDKNGAKFKPDHAAQIPFSISLKASQLEGMLEIFGLKDSFPVDIQLGPSVPLFSWKWFEALDAGKAWFEFENQRTESIWKDDVLKVVVEPTENPEWPYYKGELYYISETLTFGVAVQPVAKLTRQGDQLVGSWTVPEYICKDKKKGDPVKFHLLGYNKMTAANIDTPNYIGELDAVCESVRVDIILPSVIENASERVPDPNRPNDPNLTEADWPTTIPKIYACDDPNDEHDQRDFTAQARAFDRSSYLQELDFVFGARTTKQGGPGVSQLNAAITHDFSTENAEYHPVYATAKIRREGATIEKRVYRPFFMVYRRCDEVKDFDHRTRTTLCEQIFQERVRIGRLVSPPGGVPLLVFPPWDEKKHPWYTIRREAKNDYCSWFVGGDPHISTMDGLRFDSFSLGEFIYLAPRPGYEATAPTVQVRQQRVDSVPVGRGNLVIADWTSWNTAIAFELDETIFEFRAGQFLTPYINRQQITLTPGIYSYGEVDLIVNSATDVELRYRSNTFHIMDRFGAWLDIDSFVSQDDSLAGMAGRPNGNIEDDFQWPNGREALDAYDLANGWRIQVEQDSLFTYGSEEGPWTYNLAQDDEPPSMQELAPYLEQAEDLLAGVCDVESIDEVEVRNVAMELFVGRHPSEVAQTGLCFYKVHGQVMNELVPDLPVPGAKITVTDNGEILCETWSDRFGNYACMVPSTGVLTPMNVEVSNRGSTNTTVTRNTLPRAGGLLGIEQDLQVAPTTIQINGTVQDQTNQPLYNAEIRVSGPVNAGFTNSYTRTNATGVYTTYMMLNDGILAGDIIFKALFSPDFDISPDAQPIVTEFPRPFSGLTEHALNTFNGDIQFTGVMVRFGGRVSFLFDDAIPVEGIRLFIEPNQPHPEFESCDITSLVYISPKAVQDGYILDPRKETTDPAKVGTYFCEVPLEDLTPFDVTIKALNRSTGTVVASEPATVDPSAQGAGEPFNVVTPIRINTPVLKLKGYVHAPNGTPVAGAYISGSTNGAILGAYTHSDVTGAYTAYLPLNETTTDGAVSFGVSYLNIGTSDSKDFAGAVVGVPLTITQDFVVRGSLVEYAGRVIDLRTDQPVLGASVNISSPDDPRVNCATQTGLHPITPDEYMIPPSPFERPPLPKRCKQVIDSHAPRQIRLVYDVTTPWSTETITHSYQPPALGGYGFIGRDLLTRSITPTILELNGTITRPSGVPLAGALVKLEAAGVTTSTRTDSTGAYTAPLVLPVDILTGTVDYTVRYRSLSITDTLPFNATQYETTSLKKDLVYSPRTVYFRGNVINDYGIDLPPTTIEISSTDIIATGGTRCLTQVSVDGSYVCAVQTHSSGEIEVDYILDGVWGIDAFSDTVTISETADIVEHRKDINVDLTVLHAKGRITTPDGIPLEGVEITPSSVDILRVETHKTDANGYYNFYILLRPQTNETWNGVIQYFIGYGAEGRIFFLNYSATKDQSEPLERDFSLDMRVVSFEGSILNSLVPDLKQNGVVGSRVTVSSPQIGPLCSFAALDRYKEPKYKCQARVFTSQPFNYIYSVDGEWGTASFTGTLTNIPEPGQLQSIKRSFTISPTTVLIQGKVTDRDGRPLSGIELDINSTHFITRMQGDQLTRAYQVKTDEQGQYSVYAVVNKDATQASISYDVKYQYASTTYTLADSKQLPLQLGRLNTITTNFRFPYRKVIFTGQLINDTDSSVPLDGSLLIVSPSLDRTLCSNVAVSTENQYRCETLINTDFEYLATYRVEGNWGTTNLLNQPISGTLSSVPMDIHVQPRVVHLRGTVKTPSGTPLEGAKVRVTSYSIINERFVDLQTTTDVSGSYDISNVLGDGVSRVVVRYDVEVAGNTTTREQTFNINPLDVNIALDYDLIIETSRLTFRGELWNSLTNSAGVWSGNNQVVVDSPTLGHLCTGTLSDAFECTATLTTQQPFDVTYTIFADWGSTILNDRITTIPNVGTTGRYTATLPVTPTMLQVTGTAVLTDGMMLSSLSNATVRTSLAGRVSSPLVSSVWSAPNTTISGTFDLLVMLKEVQETTTGTLSLVFDGTFIDQYIFDVNEGIINQADAGTLIFNNYPDDTLPNNGRRIILRGTFVNSLAPNAPAAQPKGYYRLESPTLGTICAYDDPKDPPVGGYYCPVTVDNTDSFEVIVYTWGPYGGAAPRQYEVTNIPPIGQTSTEQENILFTPTTVHANGLVFEPATEPLPINGMDVTVKLVQGDKTVAQVQQRTTANGLYDLYTILPADVTGFVDIYYELDLDGILGKLAVTNRQVKVSQLNEWGFSLPFEKRRVRFAGRVTNSLVPSLGVPGQVFITAPDYTTQYCDADINPATGYYSCDATLQSSQPISVNYRINGLWGTKDVPGTVDTIAGVGSTTFVEREMQVTPTTVRFFGLVTDSYGKPLGNARIRVSDDTGSVFAGQTGGGQEVEAITNSSGEYETFVLIRPNVTRGDLIYTLNYYNVNQITPQPIFGLLQNDLNTQRLDFEIDSRNVIFNGRTRNAFEPSVGMLGSLLIKSGDETLCSTPLDDGTGKNNPELYIGEYTCTVRGVSIESLPVEYTAQGDWGISNVITDTVPFGQVGSENSFLKNLAVTPTTLRLVGRLQDGLNNPLVGVPIKVSSNDISAVQSAVTVNTDAQGLYTATVTLKDQILTGTLNYRFTVNDGSASLGVPFTATLNQLETITKNITFEDREVAFNGTILNANAGNTPVSGINVAVKDLSDTALCQVTSDTTGLYVCSTRVLDNNSIPIRYQLSGDWGTTVYSETIPASPSNITTELSRTWTISPTMLSLRGVVRDTNGAPIPNTSIQVSGAAVSTVSGIVNLQTDQFGRYAASIVLREGMTNDSLTYHVTVNGNEAAIPVPFTATANQVTTLTKDIVFTARTLNFSGSVVNAHVPTFSLPSTNVAIRTTDGANLCFPTTNSLGAYSCSIQVVNVEQFAIEYVISGDWGTTVVPGNVPSGVSGVTVDINRTLQARPTTLALRGTVFNPAGDPLSNTTILVHTPHASNLNASLQTTTDAQGVYSSTVILKSNVTSGTLRYDVSHDSSSGNIFMPYLVPAGGITSLNRDINFAPRELVFNGSVVNTLVQTMTIPQSSVDVRSSTGSICITTSDQAGNYSCSFQSAENRNYPIDYVVSGIWGSSVVTGTVTTSEATEPQHIINKDLPVQLTTLRLQGKVLDGDVGIAGATISVTSLDSVAAITAVSESDGSYASYVGLRSGVLQTGLNYQVRAGYGTDTRTVGLNNIIDRGLTPFDQNFYFIQRPITFDMNLSNNWSGLPVIADEVVVSTSNTGPLCDAQNPGQTTFTCNALIVTNQDFIATYTVTGTWGTWSFDQWVYPGTSNNPIDVDHTVSVRPPTLRVFGTSFDTGGFIRSNAVITATSPSFDQVFTTTSDGNGNYNLYPYIADQTVSGTLILTATLDSSVVTHTLDWDSMAVGVYQELPRQDLSLGLYPPALSTDPLSITEVIPAGEIVTRTLTISNSGERDLSLNAYVNVGDPWLQMPYTSQVLTPSQEITVDVTLNATSLISGTYNGAIRFDTNDPSKLNWDYPVTLQVVGVPETVISPTSLLFGDAFVGGVVTETVTVSNTGTTDVSLDEVVVSGDAEFRANWSPDIIVPGAARTVQIGFAPSAVDAFAATATITVSGVGYNLPLSGAGVLPPVVEVAPGSLSASLNVNEQVTRTLTISNTGSSPLEWAFSTFGSSGSEPDAFGYRWRDNATPGGPQFSWLDIASTGTQIIGLGDDNYVGSFPIGFDFDFYGQTYDQFYVSSNGYIGFGPVDSYGTLSQQQMPETNAPNNLIAWSWTDLLHHGDSAVYYQQTPEGLIVQFQNYGIFGNGGPRADVQILLTRYNTVQIRYNRVDDGWRTHAVGIENADGTIGHTVAYDTNYAQAGRVIEFAASPGWLNIIPAEGIVQPGDSVMVDVVFDATGLISSTYTTTVTLGSNDPLNLLVDIPVDLTVSGAPDLQFSADPLDVGTIFTGQAVTRTLIITNTGTSAVTIDSLMPSESVWSLDVTSATLQVGEAVVVEVQLSSAISGQFNSTLTATSSTGLTWSTTLSGAVLDPPVMEITPAALEEAVTSGDRFTRTLTVANNGLSDLIWNTHSLTESFLSRSLQQLNLDYQSITSLIPDHYDFSDGVNGSYIQDGGNDMFDYGNYLNTSLESHIPYMNNVVTPSLAFGINGAYFTRKYPGLFVMGASLDSLDSFYISGEVGVDGYAVTDTHVLTTTVNGVEYTGFVKQTYGTYRPSVNHLIIVPSNSALSHVAASNIDDEYHEITGLANSSQLFYLLYAGSNGRYTDAQETLTIMRQFLTVANRTSWLEGASSGGTVAAGGNSTVDVVFNAEFMSAGVYTANLFFSSNDPQTPLVTVPLTLTVNGTANLDVPDSFDSGSTYVGTSMTTTLLVTNTGTANLTISDVTSSESYWTSSISETVLTPGAVFSIPVVFAPASAQIVNGTLTIQSSLGSVDVSITGTGVAPPVVTVAPQSLSVTLAAGQQVTRSLTISNTGSDVLSYSLELQPLDTARLDVAVLGADGADDIADVASKLQSTNLFNSVTAINVNQRTPMLPELQAYDSVLVFSDSNFADPTALGDILADYADFGGGIVVMQFAMNSGGNNSIQGRFATDNYYVIQSNGYLDTRVSVGSIYDINHPLLDNVEFFDPGNIGGYRSIATLSADAVRIVDYRDALPLAVEKYITTDAGLRPRIDLNFYPVSSDRNSSFWDSSTDGARLMANALLYVGQPTWLQGTPASGSLAANAESSHELEFNATGLSAGSYQAKLVIFSNDIVQPRQVIPVTLTVTN